MHLKSIISLSFVALSIIAEAQTLSASMEKAVSACQGLTAALKTASPTPLSAANMKLKSADIVDFADIVLVKGQEMNVNGHFIFDEVFVDSLIVNKKVMSFSMQYLVDRASRSSTGVDGRICMTTKGLKAGKSAIWKTVNRDVAEFAIVAEPDGMLTMTIRDKKGNVLYAETEHNKQGASMRKAQIKLPAEKRTELFIEIVNHGKKDTSFAILKN